MGNLATMPHSEVTATLDVLDHLGLTDEDCKKLRTLFQNDRRLLINAYEKAVISFKKVLEAEQRRRENNSKKLMIVPGEIPMKEHFGFEASFSSADHNDLYRGYNMVEFTLESGLIPKVFLDGESCLSIEEYLARVKKTGGGFTSQIINSLWLNYTNCVGDTKESVLEWMREFLGWTVIRSSGDVFIHPPTGQRCVLQLTYKEDEGWKLGWCPTSEIIKRVEDKKIFVWTQRHNI